ncbi:MAG: 1,2-phenylacetyl-CoA epoxidase subunit PaaC [Pseudomonadota bacterium]
MEAREALFGALIRLADDHLILGHRLSEWCGHAPMLEEDLALPNIGLDLLGQARALYTYAGEVEGEGRDEDDFAYRRIEREYRNLLLVERPNGDFGQTMLRQLYYSAFMEPFWREAQGSSDETIAGIAGKAVKEVSYHVRHSAEWVIRLGDGTEESAARMAEAVEALGPFVAELFDADEAIDTAAEAGFIPTPASLKAEWDATLDAVFAEAMLTRETALPIAGGRQGRHGEAMGYLLADLQHIQRTFPGLTW